MRWASSRRPWWKSPVFLEEYNKVVSPYNTYLNAVCRRIYCQPKPEKHRGGISPAEHDYLFFMAVGDRSANAFARTFAESGELSSVMKENDRS